MREVSIHVRGFAFALLATMILATACQSRKPGKPSRVEPRRPGGLERFVLKHEDRERVYFLYVPPSARTRTSLPVLLVFHGEGQTPEDIIGMAGFNALADLHTFAVVYPAGTGSNPERLHWNVVKSGTYATVNEVDDLGFVDAVLAEVDQKLGIDDDRVYAAGFSHGGMLCFRLACDPYWSQQLAAIATVGSVMTVDPRDCAAVDPVPLIAFHGTDDPFSNYSGGIAREAPRNDRTTRLSYPGTVSFWVQYLSVTNLPDTGESRGDARVRHFKSPTSDVEVISWELQGGGHTWPGGAAMLPAWIAGTVNRDVNASSEIWDFFNRHSRRSSR